MQQSHTHDASDALNLLPEIDMCSLFDQLEQAPPPPPPPPAMSSGHTHADPTCTTGGAISDDDDDDTITRWFKDGKNKSVEEQLAATEKGAQAQASQQRLAGKLLTVADPSSCMARHAQARLIASRSPCMRSPLRPPSKAHNPLPGQRDGTPSRQTAGVTSFAPIVVTPILRAAKMYRRSDCAYVPFFAEPSTEPARHVSNEPSPAYDCGGTPETPISRCSAEFPFGPVGLAKAPLNGLSFLPQSAKRDFRKQRRARAKGKKPEPHLRFTLYNRLKSDSWCDKRFAKVRDIMKLFGKGGNGDRTIQFLTDAMFTTATTILAMAIQSVKALSIQIYEDRQLDLANANHWAIAIAQEAFARGNEMGWTMAVSQTEDIAANRKNSLYMSWEYLSTTGLALVREHKVERPVDQGSVTLGGKANATRTITAATKHSVAKEDDNDKECKKRFYSLHFLLLRRDDNGIREDIRQMYAPQVLYYDQEHMSAPASARRNKLDSHPVFGRASRASSR